MRTAEHMEHRNLERKWRPSFSLGPHLTEGRSNDERTEMFFSSFIGSKYRFGVKTAVRDG